MENQTYYRQQISSRIATYRHQHQATQRCAYCDQPARFRSYLTSGQNLGACAQHKARLPRAGADPR